MSALIDHGTEFGSPKTRGHWLVVGPLSFEFHRWWFRLGISAGPWYVAAYLGFAVVAVGKRRWVEQPTSRWTVRPAFVCDVDENGGQA